MVKPIAPPPSQLANGGDICIWRLVPPVGHCSSLYLGSGKRHHWFSSHENTDTMGSSKYKCYVRHLSNEPFPEKIHDLEGVKNDCFPLMYPDFNVWKKVGNRCFTCIILHCTVVSYFFPDVEIRLHQREKVILYTFQITDLFGKWLV